MKTSIKIIKNILLAFVLVSIGFTIGKHYKSGQSKLSSDINSIKAENRSVKNSLAVHVYYMHSTFRCTTCNSIEKMTKDLLDKKYSKAMKEKELIFSDVDFQADGQLAKKFGVVSSCVVVAIKENGKIIDFKRLDKVWTLMKTPSEFNDYIEKNVQLYLNDQKLNNEADK